ncbi:metal-binding protein [Aggregatibacter aphrophilus]|uniref:Metal-binding protein n=1 Tax=Aggregatibacter aphrophilus TaxID=732 RepID=A0A336N9X7_AGGAP|nr:metal-binding protein [Aggregatibacter aphrophilus]
MQNLALENLLNQKLNSDTINDYAPNGLQVEGKVEVKKSSPASPPAKP